MSIIPHLYNQGPNFIGMDDSRNSAIDTTAVVSKLRLMSATVDYSASSPAETTTMSASQQTPTSSPSRPIVTPMKSSRSENECCWRTKDCHSSVFRHHSLPPGRNHFHSSSTGSSSFISNTTTEQEENIWEINRCDAFDEEDDDYDRRL